MRSAKPFWTALALLAAGALCAAGEDGPADKKEGGEKVLTDKDAGTKVTVKEGTTVRVKLSFRGGTGFTWTLAKNSDDKVLESKGKPTTEAIKGERPIGGARLQVFTFKAASRGTSKLDLHYHRPFEKGKEPAKKFTVTVTVK
jgi:inhibitor of cysteine peptidase